MSADDFQPLFAIETKGTHRRRCRRPPVFALLAAWIISSGALSSGKQPDNALDPQTVTDEFVATALEPFWRTTEIREPIFFIESVGPDRPQGRLLFKPKEVVSVTSGTRDVKFEPGKDFIVNRAAGTISLPPGSSIPVTTLEHLYPLMTSHLSKIARKSGDRTRGIFFDEGSAYHKLQVEVTYRHELDQWNGAQPEYAGRLLPRTIAKLHSKLALTVVLCGDSISCGSNASQRTKAPPGCPPFGQLTAQALKKHFGSEVTFVNNAVDGTTSRDGLQQANDGQVSKHSPDLVIIAYGMNDAYHRRSVAEYKLNIRRMMERIRFDEPNVEFILVASMLPNAERGIPLDRFYHYRNVLAELKGPGAAIADLTSIWDELLKRKSFYDLTGNGVNHPNDFGHCIYAQTLLAMLIHSPEKSVQ